MTEGLIENLCSLRAELQQERDMSEHPIEENFEEDIHVHVPRPSTLHSSKSGTVSIPHCLMKTPHPIHPFIPSVSRRKPPATAKTVSSRATPAARKEMAERVDDLHYEVQEQLL